MFCKEKMFLEISQNSQENTCTRASFNKVAGLKPEAYKPATQVCNFIKKRLWHRSGILF